MSSSSHKREPHGKIIAAVAIGNFLEWFDFIVYALLAGILFKLFFPAEDPMTSVLVGFGTFGVAFLVRPLGGVILGSYADRHGRSRALSVTFFMMAAATAMVAVLPTYAAIGIAAPILLVLCRMLQGFSAGGEFGNATAVLIEAAPERLKGLYGSMQICSQALAVLVAAMVIFLLSSNLGADDFEHWGWRLPFMLGALLGPVGLHVRNQLTENDAFKEPVTTRVGRPLVVLVRDYRIQLVATIGLFAAVTAPNYVNSVYLPGIAVLKHGLSQADAMSGVLVAAVVMVVLVPVFGCISDRWSRSGVAIAGMTLMVPIYTLAFLAFLQNPNRETFLFLQAFYAIPYAAFAGAACTLALERFPVLVRSTGGSTGYNVATVLFGGMTPFWLAFADTTVGDMHAPLTYVLVTMGIGVAAVIVMALTAPEPAMQG